jgi:hypothetical protein
MRPLRTAAVSICIASLAFTAVACGGDDDDDKGAAPTTEATGAADATTTVPPDASSTPATLAMPNACEVVTKEQADALMQITLLDGTHSNTVDTDSCTYPGDPNGPTAQFEIYIGAGAKKFYDDDAVVLQHTFTDVPGIGDEAHEEDYTLFFRKGDRWVALRITSLDDFTKFKDGLEALAKDVATKV